MTSDHLARGFATATALGLLITPLLMRLAQKTGFLDRPGPRKGHHRPTPYLGGIAIIVAANGGAVASGAINPTTGRLLLVATVLGAIGLIDDSGPLAALPRVGCQVLAAALIWGAGIRFQLTGSPFADGLFSVVWVVGITNAFNLLDNMDGLSAGTGALGGLGIAGVALAAGQVQMAAVAVALSGACVGFLAFNLRPADIFMGDAGSMFVGTAVAALTIAVHPPGSASVRFVVPLLIISLPILDTATVAIGRARRRISILQGGRDHLSHRLVAAGLRRRVAVRTLLAAEAIGAVLAVAVARGLVDPWVGLAGAATVLAAVWVWTTRGRVYGDPVVGLPRVVLWAAAGGVGGMIALAGPAALAMVRARVPLQAGASAIQAGMQLEESGKTPAASQDFALAARSFFTAQRLLSAPGVGAGRIVPVVAVNLRAATVLTRVGLQLSQSGHQLVTATDLQALRLQNGTVPLQTLAGLVPQIQALSGMLVTSSDAVHRLPRTLLLPQIGRAVNSLDEKLTVTAKQTQQFAAAARMVPTLVGADGARRYLLVIQNNAEARATGGFIGNFGELIAQSGHVSQGRFGRIASLNAPQGVVRSVPAPADYLARYARFSPFDLWQNMNLSPDFPTVGSVAADLYARSGGPPVDGVIGVDPVALSNILRLTGPIRVAHWPVPITADNVVDVTLQGAYDALANQDRVAFLGDVAQAAFAAVTTRDLGGPLRVVQALAPAVSERHLQVYLKDPAGETFISSIGASGSFVPAHTDQIMLTTQNASANKVDYYLQRSIAYHLSLAPASEDLQTVTTARAHGAVSIQLTNGAPASGHSADALGPYDGNFLAGENRSFLSLYTPLAASTASLDTVPTSLESATEFGQHVYSAFVNIPAGAVRTLRLYLDGTINLDAGGWYTLELPRQPALGVDHVTATIDVPSGWQIQADAGSGWSRQADVQLELSGPSRIRVQIRQAGALAIIAPVTR